MGKLTFQTTLRTQVKAKTRSGIGRILHRPVHGNVLCFGTDGNIFLHIVRMIVAAVNLMTPLKRSFDIASDIEFHGINGTFA